MRTTRTAAWLACFVLAACGPKPGPGASAPMPPPEEPGAAIEPANAEVPHRVETAPSFEVKDGALVLPGPVVFETGSDRLRPESDEVLQYIGDYLSAKEYVTLLRIEGHVRDVPGDAGQTLSEKRALAVARWLVRSGISCDRLLPVGFGSTKPAFGDGRDTRIEAVNAALRGRLIGGMPADGGGRVAGDPCS